VNQFIVNVNRSWGGGFERPQSIVNIDVVTIFKVLFVEVSNRTLENRQQVSLDLEGDRDLRLFVVVKHLLTTQTQPDKSRVELLWGVWRRSLRVQDQC
jgi:hypothetical protein